MNFIQCESLDEWNEKVKVMGITREAREKMAAVCMEEELVKEFAKVDCGRGESHE
jgi:hypothetical protein